MKKSLFLICLLAISVFIGSFLASKASAGPASSTYELKNYSFGSGGGQDLTSNNYKAMGTLGEVEMGSISSALFREGGGLVFTLMANTPPAPTLSNPATNYDRLKLVINPASPSNGLTRTSSGLLAHDDFSTDTSALYNKGPGGGSMTISGGTATLNNTNTWYMRPDTAGTKVVTSRIKRSGTRFAGVAINTKSSLSSSSDEDGYDTYYVQADGFWIEKWTNGTNGGDINTPGGEVDIPADGAWGYERMYITPSGVMARHGTSTLGTLETTTDTYATSGYGGIRGGGQTGLVADWVDIRNSYQITVNGLPAGYYVKVSDGATTAKTAVSSGTIGNSGGADDSYTTLSSGSNKGSHFQVTQDINVSKLTARLSGLGNTGNQVVKALIYADSGGYPGSLIAVGTEQTVLRNAAIADVDLPFSTPVHLTPGTYWLNLISGYTGSNIRSYYSFGSAGDGTTDADNYDNPADPWSGGSLQAYKYRIWATYAATSTVVDASQVLFPLASLTIYNGDPDSGGSLVTSLSSSNYSDMGGGDVYTYSSSTSSPPDLTYAASISTDNFVKDIRYIQSDKTPGLTLTSSSFQDYNSFWGGASGTFISGLTNPHPVKTFGNTVAGAVGNYRTIGNGYHDVAHFNLSESGTISKLTASLSGLGNAGSQVCKGTVYSDSSGNPNSLLGTSSEITVTQNSAQAWYDLNFPTPISLNTGTYWLGLHCGTTSNNVRLYYSADGASNTSQEISNDTYSDGPINPWSGGTTGIRIFSIYATYTTTTNYSVKVKARHGNYTESYWSPVSATVALSDPSLTFGLDTSSITFNNLNASNSYTDASKQTVLTTSTNAYNGYAVWANESGPLSTGSDTISDYTGTNSSPTTWSGGTTGFGYSSNDSDLETGSGSYDRFTTGGPNFAGFQTTPNQDPVADHTTKIQDPTLTNENFTVYYKVVAPSNSTAGNYHNTIIYTVVPIY